MMSLSWGTRVFSHMAFTVWLVLKIVSMHTSETGAEMNGNADGYLYLSKTGSCHWFCCVVSYFTLSHQYDSSLSKELLLMRVSCTLHFRCFCERLISWFIYVRDVRVEQEPRAGSGESLMKVKSGRSPWAVTCFMSCPSTHWKWTVNGLHLRITGRFVENEHLASHWWWFVSWIAQMFVFCSSGGLCVL